MTSVLITSRTGVSGPLPCATARIAMSRSVIIPTSRSLSPTGIAPASISAMIFATSRMLWPGLATRTSRVIASLTRIFTPSLGGLFPLSTKQEIDRNRQRADSDGDAASDRNGGGRDDEKCRLRGECLGRRNGDKEGRRDRQPAPDVGHQHPAHRPVVRKRAFAYARRAVGSILEEREWIEIEQKLPRERQRRAPLAQEECFDVRLAHALVLPQLRGACNQHACMGVMNCTAAVRVHVTWTLMPCI